MLPLWIAKWCRFLPLKVSALAAYGALQKRVQLPEPLKTSPLTRTIAGQLNLSFNTIPRYALSKMEGVIEAIHIYDEHQ